MSNTDYIKTLSENIVALRKKNGLTQEALASQLGLSFQAISKWENGQSSPDITLLPKLAEIFDVSIDNLFGISTIANKNNGLPWEDDGILRAVVFKGNEILKTTSNEPNFTFEYKGEALNVISHCDIVCNSISNGAKAGCDITCNGDISGGASADCDINVSGYISGGASAGCDINSKGVSGGVFSKGDINCEQIAGDVKSEGDISCSNMIKGDVKCDGDVSCSHIDGNVKCNGDISYR